MVCVLVVCSVSTVKLTNPVRMFAVRNIKSPVLAIQPKTMLSNLFELYLAFDACNTWLNMKYNNSVMKLQMTNDIINKI